MVTARRRDRGGRGVSSAGMGLAEVERSFGELLAAFGDLVVARSRGAPAEPPGGSIATVVRRYRGRRRAFGEALGGLPETAHRGAEDGRARATMRATLAWLDELEPTPGAQPVGSEALVDDDPTATRARAGLYRRYGAGAGAIRLGRETLDRPTILGRLATEPDRGERRRLFLALEPLWRTVDGDGGPASPYRRLLRSSAARWQAHGSPVDANVEALGLIAAGFEATLHRILAAWRSVVGPDRLEPWDYRYATGGAARSLDRLVPVDRLLDLDHRYLASLGADVATLGIQYDVLPRPGRPTIPVAFSIGMGGWAADQPSTGPWTPRPPWVFATYAEGGLGSLAELLHESGHALHSAALRTRPAFLEWPDAETAFLEGTADLLGWDADEPDWQRHWLGAAAEPRDARAEPLRRGHARRLLGALRDRAPSPPGPAPKRCVDGGHHRRAGHRSAPGVVMVGDPRPAHRRARLSRQLRPVRDHGCRRPCTGARGPRALVRGRPWLVRLHVGRLFAAGASRRPADLLHDFSAARSRPSRSWPTSAADRHARRSARQPAARAGSAPAHRSRRRGTAGSGS